MKGTTSGGLRGGVGERSRKILELSKLQKNKEATEAKKKADKIAQDFNFDDAKSDTPSEKWRSFLAKPDLPEEDTPVESEYIYICRFVDL